MKKAYYAVKAAYLCGDKGPRRERQLEILKEVGVQELKDEPVVIADAEQAMALIAAGYCGDYFSVSQLSKAMELVDTTTETLVSNFALSFDRLSQVFANKLTESEQTSFNKRCQQQQPNLALLNVTETMLLEDSCTDNLQGYLAKGWRILAIQPQPDQRRPDYILGRTHKEELPDRAERG